MAMISGKLHNNHPIGYPLHFHREDGTKTDPLKIKLYEELPTINT
jgi:hypothetical protein